MSHSLSVFHGGSVAYLAVSADIAEGWHINSDEPLEKYLIPTVLKVTAPAGIEVVRVLYPEPVLKKLDISPTEMALYHGHVVFGAIVRVAEDAAPGSYRIAAELSYQGCNNLMCVEPASVAVEDTIRVGTVDEAVEALSPDLFSQPPFADAQGQPVGLEAAAPNEFERMIGERGLLVVFIIVFLGGLALNLTPCIYPLIPITVSYFGGQAAGKTSRVFLLALLYVLGMSITYSVLGTIAAMTGSLFGSALQNPWVILFIAAVLIALALSMFGLWEMRMPMFLTRRTGAARRGAIGAVVMGLTVGIIAAPCIGPFVLGLLTYVGNLGRPLLGFLLFFTLAWGLGAPFIVLGVLSGSIARLPRSGDWMIWVRKIFGFILLAMALYFARNLAGARLVVIGYAMIALIAGLYLGWIDRSVKGAGGFRAVRTATGIAGVAIAAALLIIPAVRGGAGTTRDAIPWQPFSEERLDQAAREEKPVVIHFSAAWCIPCHELEKKTFPDPGVRELAANVVPLSVDLTKSGAEEERIKNRFGVRGVPTIIFIDRSGREMSGIRATGFIGPQELTKRLGELLGKGADS
jgi:thiol:disulfide interchange protein DsbD